MLRNLCIIPARGGSKRIPHKNIKEFLGKPIIAYSIQSAIDSGLFEEIIVSTDDKSIAEIALQFGAKVPFIRSEANSNDFATLSDVIEEVKSFYLSDNRTFDNICCVLATAPFVTADLLRGGYQEMISKELDSIRPIVKFGYPIQRAYRLNEGHVEMFNPEYYSTRSQDLEPAYHDAGMFYWMNFELGLKGIKKGGYEIPEISTQDIDTVDDWNLAEFKFRYLFSE